MENGVNRKQNRKVMIFACILSVISIGLLILGFFLVSSDKVVLLQSVSNLFNKFSESSESSSVLVDKIASSQNVGLTSNISITSDLLNASLKLDYLENKDNKKSKLTLDLNINEEEMIDANLALVDEKVHLFVDDITPNYYYTDLEYIAIFSELKSSDYDKITTLLKDIITDYIDDGDISKEKVEISYNGKDKKVNKLTYEITNKTIKDVVTKFFDSIKEDKTLLENIASSLNITTKDVETSMDDILSSIDTKEEKVLYNYIVYYYGFNKIVGYELEEIETKTILEYKVQDTESINLYQEEKQVLNIDITTDKKQHNFVGFIQGEEEKVEFTGNITDNVITINIEDIKCIITYNSKENDFYTEYNITLYQTVDNQETELCTIKMTNQYYFDKEVDINLDNSININDITEEEMNTIYSNLMNHPLYTLVAGYLMSSEPEV